MSRLQQGCGDIAEQGNLNLLRSGASTGSAAGTNAALANGFGKNPSQFCTPLDFELLTSRGPFHPSSFGDLLEYVIDFADWSQVLIPTDNNSNYSLNNISLQLEIVRSQQRAANIALEVTRRFALSYERIVFYI